MKIIIGKKHGCRMISPFQRFNFSLGSFVFSSDLHVDTYVVVSLCKDPMSLFSQSLVCMSNSLRPLWTLAPSELLWLPWNSRPRTIEAEHFLLQGIFLTGIKPKCLTSALTSGFLYYLRSPAKPRSGQKLPSHLAPSSKEN